MTPLDSRTLSRFKDRLAQVTATTPPRWGSMKPGVLMPHLRTLIEVSLEEITVPDVAMPLAKTFLFRWGVLYLPWPKGKIKAPESLFPAGAGAFDEEREKLAAAMDRFVQAAAAEPERRTRSPLLGPVSLADWARLHGKHLEHHLDQFGV